MASIAAITEPAATGVGRQAVDVIESQPGIGDRGLACRDGQRQRRHHQSSTDLRHADPGERHLVFELLRREHRPHVLTEAFRRDLVDRERRRLGVFDYAEQRQPHVFVLLEDNLHLLAQFQLFSVTFDDVGGQPHARVFGDGDLRDDVGRGQAGHAESVVDGESGKRGPARHHPHNQVVRAAVSAYRRRWMNEGSAVGAFL
jgi:hypothetical protein